MLQKLSNEYALFILGIGPEDRVNVDESLLNFFKEEKNRNVKIEDIKENYSELYEFAKANYFDLNIFKLYNLNDYSTRFFNENQGLFEEALMPFLNSEEIQELLDTIFESELHIFDVEEIVEAFREKTL